MLKESKQTFYALAILVGTIMGLGAFGLPYAFAHAGIGLGMAYLGVMTVVVLTMHLVYGEIVLRTPAKHRLIGYAEIYLGRPGRIIATHIMIFGIYGGLLAYTIVGGVFLEVFMQPFVVLPTAVWSMIFFAIMAFYVIRGLKNSAPAELVMNIVLLAVFVGIIIRALPDVEMANLTLSTDLSQAFLPYGIVFFALAGSAAIPELRDILEGDGRMKRVIIIGSLIPAILYALFAFGIAGALGTSVSKDAVISLADRYGTAMAIAAGLVGLLTTATSFIVLGLVLKHAYRYDLGISRHKAAFAVLVVPLALYFFATQDFLKVIGFVGAVLGGIEGLLMLAMYRKAKIMGERTPEYALMLPAWVYGLIAAMFIAGIGYEIIYTFI